MWYRRPRSMTNVVIDLLIFLVGFLVVVSLTLNRP